LKESGDVFKPNSNKMSAHLPKNETGRLAALSAFQVLDTPPDKEFDLIMALASRLCGTPNRGATFYFTLEERKP